MEKKSYSVTVYRYRRTAMIGIRVAERPDGKPVIYKITVPQAFSLSGKLNRILSTYKDK